MLYRYQIGLILEEFFFAIFPVFQTYLGRLSDTVGKFWDLSRIFKDLNFRAKIFISTFKS